jgi:hypothetical protein
MGTAAVLFGMCCVYAAVTRAFFHRTSDSHADPWGPISVENQPPISSVPFAFLWRLMLFARGLRPRIRSEDDAWSMRWQQRWRAPRIPVKSGEILE